jgi:hypothetical protein
VSKRNSNATSYSSETMIHLGEDIDDENVIVNLERPIGKKVVKEKKKKKKKKDCDGGFD